MSVIHSPTLSSSTPLQEQFVIPDYIGKRVDPNYSKTLQIKVKEILRSQHNSFPGSQPISFELKHLNVLEREDYFVCEKSDGIRCLLFFVHSPKGPATFMLDRNQIWFYVPNLVFPVRGRESEYLKDTLMDGELVLDKDEQKKTWRFLIFDLMAINGTPIIQRSFNTRLGMLQQDVIQPLKTSLRHISDPSKTPPFKVELKKMERAYGLHLVFDMMTKLGHNSDGIIWTPVKCPYVPGICDKLLKWKPPELTTADFRINAKWSKEHKPIYYLEVLSHVTYKFYDHFQPEPDIATKWKEHLPDGRIAEFRYDPDWKVTIVEQGYAPMTRKGGWRFVRFRDDKDAANDEIDVKKIKNSILDGVSKEQLLAHMDYIRAAWKAREKGLPQPPLKDLKIRGSLTLANVPSSVSTPSLTTPTAISPVLPSPAFNHNTSNYFPHDHDKSRQNSIDYNSIDRRNSMAELTTEMSNSKHDDDDDDNIQENDIELKITKSLPGSRRQSTAQPSKRDGNLQNEEGMERKRHKSLTELESSHQEINAKLENLPKENTINIETAKLEPSNSAGSSMNNKKQPYLESPVSEHTHKQLSPIPENLPLEKNSLRRKVSNLENDELPKSGTQIVEQESTKERKVRKVQDSQTKEIPPRLKYKNEINQEIQKLNEQSKITSLPLDSSSTYAVNNSIDQVKHSGYIKQGNDNKIRNSHNYVQSPSVTANYSIKPEYDAVSSDSYIDNRNNHEKKYDPARSPSNSSIPISTFTDDKTSNTAVNTSKNEYNNTPSKSKSQNSNIHQLLTSTMEPMSPSQKQTDQSALKVTKSTSHKSFKLSTLLHDDKKVEPSYEDSQNEQQRSQAEKHHLTSSSQPSHTPPVQFINFRAEQPQSQGTLTSKQKTIFIQGEYYNNAPTSPNKSKNETNTVYHQHQHQQLQPQQLPVRRSNTNTPSSQSTITEKHINNRLSQGSVHGSPISSPLSSPKDSRHGHQITVWKADVGVNSPNPRQQQVQKQHQPPPPSPSQQQQWQSQTRSEYNYSQNYNASHSSYEMPPHTYYPSASSPYVTNSQPPPPPPSTSHHPHSHSHPHPYYEHQHSYVNQSRPDYNGYENHYPEQQQQQQHSPQQSYQTIQSNQPTNEYHIDHRSSYNSHQRHHSYHDQRHHPSTNPSSTPKHPERKSGKSKLDFILN